MPYGVGSVETFKAKLTADNPKDYKDGLTVENRHTYFRRPKSSLTIKKNIRLRARQVLCHQCKNVCTENGKNAQFQLRKNKFRTKSSKYYDLCVKTFTLVPRVKRLKVNEILKFKQSQKFIKTDEKIIQKQETKPKKFEGEPSKSDNSKIPDQTHPNFENNEKFKQKKPSEKSQEIEPKRDLNQSGIENLTPLKIKILPESRNLRKKRSLGSMEDLWDETILEDKIHIPSLIHKLDKKAMKKAKKEAKKLSKKKQKKLSKIHSDKNSIRTGEVVNMPVIPVMPSPSESQLASPIHCLS